MSIVVGVGKEESDAVRARLWKIHRHPVDCRLGRSSSRSFVAFPRRATVDSCFPPSPKQWHDQDRAPPPWKNTLPSPPSSSSAHPTRPSPIAPSPTRATERPEGLASRGFLSTSLSLSVPSPSTLFHHTLKCAAFLGGVHERRRQGGRPHFSSATTNGARRRAPHSHSERHRDIATVIVIVHDATSHSRSHGGHPARLGRRRRRRRCR